MSVSAAIVKDGRYVLIGKKDRTILVSDGDVNDVHARPVDIVPVKSKLN